MGTFFNKRIISFLFIFFIQLQSYQLDVTVYSHLGGGFFSELGKVLDNLIHFEPDLHTFEVNWKQRYFPYKDDPQHNGWELFFEPIIITHNNNDTIKNYHTNGAFHELHDFNCLDTWLCYDNYLPYRKFISQKIAQYIHIKNHIQEKIDRFYNQHMNNDNCCRIGIHVRYAQAHDQEKPNVPSLLDYINEAKQLIEQQKDKQSLIFLATDSKAVITAFKKSFPHSLIYQKEIFRSADRQDPHLIYENPNYFIDHPEEFDLKKPGYKGGVAVLMDCLLLAKCDYFIHSTSNVASFVSYFNPEIKSIFLPKITKPTPCIFKNRSNQIRNQWILELS